jgi:purine-binding chemotaxis protein CheW
MAVPTGSAPGNDSHAFQFCSFWVGERLFGVDILDVKEVNTDMTFTPVFHAPPVVRGLINIRGQIYLILDLRRILGYEPDDALAGKRIILFKPHIAEPFGILVDRIGDVIPARANQIETTVGDPSAPPDGKCGPDRGPQVGICKLQDDLMVILNPRRFLNAISGGGE